MCNYDNLPELTEVAANLRASLEVVNWKAMSIFVSQEPVGSKNKYKKNTKDANSM